MGLGDCYAFLYIVISTVLHVDLLALHWLTGCNSERTIQVSNISHVVLKVPPLSSIKGWLLSALLDPGLVAVAIYVLYWTLGFGSVQCSECHLSQAYHMHSLLK